MPSNGLFPPNKRDRRARITKLEKAIKNSRNPKAAIANFCLEEGVSLRTIREYLKFLRLAGKIEDDVVI